MEIVKKINKHFIWWIAFLLTTKKEWSPTNDIPPNTFIISVWLIATPENQPFTRFSRNIVLNEHFESRIFSVRLLKIIFLSGFLFKERYLSRHSRRKEWLFWSTLPLLIDKITFEYQPGNYTYRFTGIHRLTNINLSINLE